MFRWRWLLFDYIPPEIELWPRERKAIRGAVRSHKVPLSREGWHRHLLAFVVLGGLIALLFVFRRAFMPMPPLPIVLVAVWLVNAVVYGPDRARRTYQELRERGFDVCPECGFWLRGAASDVCPECGTARPQWTADTPPRTLPS